MSPQQAVGPAHVPVRLRPGRDLRRIVGAELPHRVDRQQRAHDGGDAEDDEEEPARLGGVHRQHGVADDVLLRAAGPGPLGVLVEHQQQHVGGDEREQQTRDEQHVDGVEPRNDRLTRELPAEQEEGHVGADDRGGLHEPVGGADTGSGEQVVGQRVAGEALERAQEQQQGADHPVELAGLAERAGEVDPQEVDHHRGDEDHRGPVVHLPQQQPAADVERQEQRGAVRLRHPDAAHRVVGALVLDLAHRRHVPEGQEHAGEQQDDEAPQRDLAQHERPVVGEDLAELLLHGRAEAEALVGPVGDDAGPVRLLRGGGLAPVAVGHLARVDAHQSLFRSQKLAPTGSSKSSTAMR